MNTQSIYRVGIVLYALVIGFFGINHFLNGTGFQNTIPSFIPYHIFWVYLTGVALIAAAISFLIGKKTKMAGLFLFLYLIIIVLSIHLPAVIRSEGSPIVSIALTNLVKDTGLAAAALMIAGRGDPATA
ncbi:MAG: DoxX family protein [Bacteroidota bacterium]|jgi:putative oxidoreductase|nr:DoxX family protein [Bacteroidota bacterium]